MEPASGGSTHAKIGLVLQVAALACAVGGVAALSIWFVPTLQAVYAGAGLAWPAHLILMWQVAAGYWWLVAILGAALFFALGRKRPAQVAAARRRVALSAFLVAAVAFLAVYAASIAREYDRAVFMAVDRIERLRQQVEADSARAGTAAVADPEPRR